MPQEFMVRVRNGTRLHTGVCLHVRTFVFLTAGLLTTAHAAEPTAGGSNGVNVSWGDHIVVFKNAARLDTPEKIRDAMPLWKNRMKAGHIFWRVSGITLERDYVRHGKSISRYWQVTEQIFSQFDPVTVAVEAAHANGLKIYAYLCIFDEGCPPTVLYGHTTPFPWQSKFTLAHPEYLAVDRTQTKRHWGVLEYGYPEARRYKVEQLANLSNREGIVGELRHAVLWAVRGYRWQPET